ncbi:MAG: NAD(P)/FAD-dependent oxidoreductase [Jatrophihabitantaceae bacterium]
MPTEHVDVLIIGAGLSGIGAACHLTRECPGKTYRIVERRQAIGGTWDLFRYPGIRSDSDMMTFSYNFRPWTSTKVLSDGEAIREYVVDTAKKYGVPQHIRFGRQVINGNWSSADQRWTLTALNEASGETETFTANFIIGCTGYYNYDKGYEPDFPGRDEFAGQIVHPQRWPEDLDYAGKRVVVIGSGATAVTLVPAMAKIAAHVTMLQRSPTWIVSLPSEDNISATLRKVLPARVVHKLARQRNILIQRATYTLFRSNPTVARKIVLAGVKRQLGPNIDVKHFTPSYDPWTQRLCVIPDGDLFRVLRKGKASVVTAQIETFTKTGIRLKSGDELEADIVVTATGLQIQMLGGAHLSVDGVSRPLRETVTYKGVMVEGVPNAAMIFGYTNASWTLKADIASEYICRLINHMDKRGSKVAVPNAPYDVRGGDSIMGGLDSGYVRRGNDLMPRQGTEQPWMVLNNYLRDAPTLRNKPIDDGLLQFT